MNCDELDLDPPVRAALRRAGLKGVRDVLGVPAVDLQRQTGLFPQDVQRLLSTAAAAWRTRAPVPALQLGPGCGLESGLRLSVGCPLLDELLRGGLPAGGVTELCGQSGAGKTQLALQLCLTVQYPETHGGLQSGVLYVCTEDRFPIRRLQQLISEQSRLRPDVPPEVLSCLRFSDHVYIEHTADLDSLQLCLSRRARVLLARGLVRLLVLDSVAAPLRCEFQADDWLTRNKQLLSVSCSLQALSREFRVPVVCINQVTDVFSQSDETLGPSPSSLSPALGLAWANQVTVRLMMRRLSGTVSAGGQSSAPRRLEVLFAPHLARGGRGCAVWREGVRGVAEEE
uniref:RecA family profile 1 domain-containing protein n=2 Tax=Salarias fasciatus TaxID=181472 RepID=A0A672HIW8_SALFA